MSASSDAAVGTTDGRVTWLISIPFSYAVATRLRTSRAFTLRLFFEFLPQIVIIHALGSRSWPWSIGHFALAWLAFVSVYELGYLYNDLVASRHEERPTRRPTIARTGSSVWIWVGARIIIFAIALWVMANLDFPRLKPFALSMAILSVVFLLHNLLPVVYRPLTFIFLTLARFLLPISMFITTEDLARLLPAVLLCYSLYRLLVYLRAKGSSPPSSVSERRFPLIFYLALLPLSTFLAILIDDRMILELNLYYMALFAVGAATRRMPRRRRNMVS